MDSLTLFSPRLFLPIIVAAWAFFCTSKGWTQDLMPKSPEVQACVVRAIKYLESNEAAQEQRPGGKALIGLALVKNGAPPNHPRAMEAVRALRGAIPGLANAQPGGPESLDIYSIGLSIIFLTNLDPVAYRPEIEALLRALAARQKPHGGWGYPGNETGDTSMTQFGVLSSWEASQAGFSVPTESMDRVAVWLLKTQDPGGGWGYQGVVAPGPELVPQNTVRHGLSTAGLGSVYLLSSLYGPGANAPATEDDLPPALRAVEQRRGPQKLELRVDPRLLQVARQRGNAWMEARYRIDPPEFTHYYLYALERYWSFRELLDGPSPDDPPWYDDGARYLMKTQQANGAWNGQCGVACDTAFSVLFLVRSMKKSLERARDFGGGLMIGGRGLPKDTGTAKVARDGQIIARPLTATADALLRAIDDPEGEGNLDALESLADLPADEARSFVSANAKRLKEMAGGTSGDARLAAVRAMAAAPEMEHVPTLIYALTDPEPAVVLAADEALRRLARRTAVGGLAEGFTEPERDAAIAAWKAWYLAVRPDAEFEP